MSEIVRERVGVVLVNTGTPASPSVADVRSYLGQFLNDPRVIDIPAWQRWLLPFILNWPRPIWPVIDSVLGTLGLLQVGPSECICTELRGAFLRGIKAICPGPRSPKLSTCLARLLNYVQ